MLAAGAAPSAPSSEGEARPSARTSAANASCFFPSPAAAAVAVAAVAGAMSLETRSSSALFKRAEQLKRWEQSETNREPAQPRQVARKIKFSADCVFLAACAASDKEEVVRLLQKGADINTGNVDGLTALHQVRVVRE